jgi:diguanylate cyclase
VNNYQLYREKLSISSQKQLILEKDIHYALAKKELSLYYQPQVDLWTGKIVGLEALMRWNHPQLGIISPSEFIPIAETTGLIIPMGEWALHNACKQIQDCEKVHISPLKIAVNLSVYQFRQPNLCEKIKHIIKETGIKPNLIELELTESVILDDLEEAKSIMSQLKALGIDIAIDDFGTGYSSLKYLQNLPFNTLKIDQSFIRNITNNPSNIAITKAIIAMAQALNLNVIAEGIETEAELGFLRLHHCQFGQGYLFHKPLPENKLALLLCLNSARMTKISCQV